MSDTWYVQTGEQQYGPITSAELKQWASEGRVQPQTWVRQGEAWQWVAASQQFNVTATPRSSTAASRYGRRKQKVPVVWLVGGGVVALLLLCGVVGKLIPESPETAKRRARLEAEHEAEMARLDAEQAEAKRQRQAEQAKQEEERAKRQAELAVTAIPRDAWRKLRKGMTPEAVAEVFGKPANKEEDWLGDATMMHWGNTDYGVYVVFREPEIGPAKMVIHNGGLYYWIESGSGGGRLTWAMYEQLEDGMLESDVTQIFGKEPVEISSSSAGSTTMKMVKFTDEENPLKAVTCTFTNGRLSAKAQMGRR